MYNFKVSNFKIKLLLTNYSKKTKFNFALSASHKHISFEFRFVTSSNNYFQNYFYRMVRVFYILLLYRIFTIWKHGYIAIVTIKLISYNYQLRFSYINCP